MNPAGLLQAIKEMEAAGRVAPVAVQKATVDAARRVRAAGVQVAVSPTARGAVVHYIAVPGPQAVSPAVVANRMAPRLTEAVQRALEGL